MRGLPSIERLWPNSMGTNLEVVSDDTRLMLVLDGLIRRTGLDIVVQVPLLDDLLSSSMVKGVFNGEQLCSFCCMSRTWSNGVEGEGVDLEVLEDMQDSCPRDKDLMGETGLGLDFCLLLQNHTRTSSGSRSSCWEISSITWRLGRGFWQKKVSKVDFVCGAKTALFFRLRLAITGILPAQELNEFAISGLSASSSHCSRTTLMVVALVGLSCICSKRLMVLWAKLL